MKRSLLVTLFLAVFAVEAWCGLSLAQDADLPHDKMTMLMRTEEVREMVSGLNAWTPKAGTSRTQPLSEDAVKKIYEEFSAAIIPPLDPVTRGVGPAKEISPDSLDKIEKLARKVQGIFAAMSQSDLDNYGRLIGLMREALYLDAKYLSGMSAGDNADAMRWHEIINSGMKEVEREYIRIAISAWGVETIREDGAGENNIGEANMPDGSVYKGYFENGLFNGKGARIWKDGHKYEGEYKDGLPHGRGIETMSDGTRYEGGFKDGEWYGKGTVTWKDGKRYEVENY